MLPEKVSGDPRRSISRQADYFFFLAAFFLVAFFLVAFLAFFFAAMSTTPLSFVRVRATRAPPPKNVNNMNYLFFEMQIGLDIQKAPKMAMCKKAPFYKA